jgi:hypothetical protein
MDLEVIKGNGVVNDISVVDSISTEVINVDNMKVNVDYSVDTYTIYNNKDMNIHTDLEDFYKDGYVEDDIDRIEEDVVNYSLAMRLTDDKIDSSLAYMCNYGVLTMLTGKYKGQKFMFPLLDNEGYTMTFIAYSLLKNNVVTKEFVRKMTKDSSHMKRCLGARLYLKISRMLKRLVR